ncbi:MAG: hypothetical protein U0P30_16795 [Vicinamibacterales bacterium]
MEDVQNRLARELADAVAAAVAQSADVERCRERARAEGFHLKVTLEATVGFAPLAADGEAAEPGDEPVAAPVSYEISANDRRFLRSLRIASDEAPVTEATDAGPAA